MSTSNFVICESNTFTSSAEGGLGFTSSKKKKGNFNFTPSPKSEDIFINEQQIEYFFDIDTNENTPLQESSPINHKMESDFKSTKIDKFKEEFNRLLSNKKIQINNFLKVVNEKYPNYNKKNEIEEKSKHF